MNPFSFSGLLVLISSLFFGFFVFSKNTKNRVNQLWALFSIAVALWGLAAFRIGLIPEEERALAVLWWRITYLGIIFIPVLFYHFVHAWLELKRKIFLYLFYLWGFFFFILEWTPWGNLFFGPNTITYVFSTTYIVRPATPLFTFFVLCWVSISFYSHYRLYRTFKKSVGLKKSQIKYFFLATAVGFFGGGATFLIPFGVNIYPALNFAVPLYPAIMSYAILRYRLMDIRVVFTRAGIFLVVYTFVLGIPFILLSRTGSGLLATSAAVVLATIGPLIYLFLQKKAENVLLAQQRRYQRILLQAAMGMSNEHNLAKLSKLVVYILKKAIRLNFTVIFIINKEKNVYQLAAIRGQAAIENYEKSVNCDGPFINYLKSKSEPSLFDEIPLDIKGSSILLNKSKVVIPAFTGDELLGFVLLGEKLNNQLYSDEDMGVFKILSRQSALAIENCLFFKETKESQERMFAAEKLASIGGMADGVAHQIKNRLNQFSVASGELKFEIEDFSNKHSELLNNNLELKTTLEYLTKISTSLIENVKRTDSIIKGILDFAKVGNKENFFGKFSLKEVTDLAYNLLMVKHETAKLPITVELGDDNTIYGIKSQITEAIYNMLDNAYEAAQENMREFNKQKLGPFTPAVKLKLEHLPERDIIKISDNGIGIKEDDKHKIFAPFFTTKSSYKSGSGIGAYVVKRIIEENHKGKIWFVSTYMKGTEFFIELPRNQ